MPVCVPSRSGSMRTVATTRTLPPGPGWTFTSPNGSTTFFSCMAGLRGAASILLLVDLDIGLLAVLAELQRQAAPLGVSLAVDRQILDHLLLGRLGRQRR